MPPSPAVIVFDVNETLSDLRPLADRFTAIGAPATLAPLWFASVLRDGFALTAVGGEASFARLGAEALRAMLHGTRLRRVPADGLDGGMDAAVQHVLDGVGRLPLHADVADGVRGLRADGHRLVALTNGSAQVAERLLEASGLRDGFEAVLSVEDAGAWKPAAAAYAYAATACDVAPGRMMLAAVHPWDVDGAARAGLRTAWIDRHGTPYPGSFRAPDTTATGLVDLRTQLAAEAD